MNESTRNGIIWIRRKKNQGLNATDNILWYEIQVHDNKYEEDDENKVNYHVLTKRWCFLSTRGSNNAIIILLRIQVKFLNIN